MLFRLALSERARQTIERLSTDQAVRIRDCLDALGRNPYRDMDQRVTLVVPLERVYRNSYRCGELAIAYDFEGNDVLLIQAIGNLFY